MNYQLWATIFWFVGALNLAVDKETVFVGWLITGGLFIIADEIARGGK